MTLPLISGRGWRGGSFAAGPAAPAEEAASLLLDDFGSAAVAYSLRLLRTDYSGNCIRVRRASDNAELDIGFASNVLDTSALEDHCSGTDGFIVEWYDQSGNGNDASQATVTYQPKIVSSGTTITQNSKPSIEFDGNDNYLMGDTRTMGGGVPSFNSTDMSLFAVATMDNLPTTGTPNGMHLFAVGSGSGGGSYHVNYGDKISVWYDGVDANWRRIATSGGTGLNIEGAVAAADTQYLVAFTGADGGTFSLSMNGGTAVTSTTARNSYGYSKSSIGAGVGNATTPQDEWDGTIQELVQWQADQESNKTDIVSNINTFYSVF